MHLCYGSQPTEAGRRMAGNAGTYDLLDRGTEVRRLEVKILQGWSLGQDIVCHVGVDWTPTSGEVFVSDATGLILTQGSDYQWSYANGEVTILLGPWA